MLKVAGEAPLPRAYHTANVVGDCCWIMGGRNLNGYVLSDDHLACFNIRRQCWVAPGRAKGAPPLLQRSSHRHACCPLFPLP